MSSILERIANPVMADVPGSFSAGRNTVLAQAAAQQDTVLKNEQLKSAQLSNKTGQIALDKQTETETLKDLASTAEAAFALGDTPEADQLWDVIIAKAPPGASQATFKKIKELPPGLEKNKLVLTVLNNARNKGYLPQQTAELNERKQLVDEGQLAVNQRMAGAAEAKAAQEKDTRPNSAKEFEEYKRLLGTNPVDAAKYAVQVGITPKPTSGNGDGSYKLGQGYQSTDKDGNIVLSQVIVQGGTGAMRVESRTLDGTLVNKLGQSAEQKIIDAAKEEGAKKAAEYEVKLKNDPILAQNVKLTEQAVAEAGKYNDAVKLAKADILLLSDASKELTDGAITGPFIDKWTPTFKASTKRLELVQSKLGLNIIKDTTFGALSEYELDIALRTGLPTGLQAPELKKWIADTTKARQKLANYYERAAIFLSGTDPQTGKPNSIADWTQKNRDQVRLPSHPKYGDVTEGRILDTMETTGQTREEVLNRLMGGTN